MPPFVSDFFPLKCNFFCVHRCGCVYTCVSLFFTNNSPYFWRKERKATTLEKRLNLSSSKPVRLQQTGQSPSAFWKNQDICHETRQLRGTPLPPFPLGPASRPGRAGCGRMRVRMRVHPAGSPRRRKPQSQPRAARTPAYREAVPGVCLGINQIAGFRGKGRKRHRLCWCTALSPKAQAEAGWAAPGQGQAAGLPGGHSALRPGGFLCALRPFPAGPPLRPLGLLPTSQGHSHLWVELLTLGSWPGSELVSKLKGDF